MTELEKMERAKMYIDKMANGINPITDEYVKENDTVNNIRISRCLFYVSDILRRVIENGGNITSKKAGNSRVPFFITDEQKTRLRKRTDNCYAKDIAEEINNATVENNTAKMQAAWINNWLLSIGMLEIIDNKKHATSLGKDIGIITELRQSQKYGSYYVNLYTPQAQEFVYDNIDAIIEYRYNGNNA